MEPGDEGKSILIRARAADWGVEKVQAREFEHAGNRSAVLTIVKVKVETPLTHVDPRTANGGGRYRGKKLPFLEGDYWFPKRHQGGANEIVSRALAFPHKRRYIL